MRLNGRISEGALRTALRVRSEAVEQARQSLSAAIGQSDLAAGAERAAIAAISSEADAAASLSSDDSVVEAYAAWLPEGRRKVEAARARRDAAEARVVVARAALAAARAEEAATEALLAAHADARRQLRLRREQISLDEAAARGART